MLKRVAIFAWVLIAGCAGSATPARRDNRPAMEPVNGGGLCRSPFLYGGFGDNAANWYYGTLTVTRDDREHRLSGAYVVAWTMHHIRGPANVHFADVVIEGDLSALSEHEHYLVGVVPVESHPRLEVDPFQGPSTRPPIDGRIVALAPLHWPGQGDAMLAALDAHQCPEMREPLPARCRDCGAEPDSPTGCGAMRETGDTEGNTVGFLDECDQSC